MAKKTTQIIAWIALAISLTGGIPGMISTYESLTKSPKLNVIFRNSITGNINIDSKEKSFILLVLTIGNRGDANFKRFVSPEAEILIGNKWIKLQSVGLSDQFIDIICNQVIKTNNKANWLEMLKNKTIPDYYHNNFLIAPDESYDLFLYFDADSDQISSNEINESKVIRITLKDVKNNDYIEEIKLK